MLLSVAHSSASTLTLPLLELVQSYIPSNDFPQARDILTLISKCLCLMLSLTDTPKNQELSILNHPQYLLTHISQANPQTMSHESIAQVRVWIEEA